MSAKVGVRVGLLVEVGVDVKVQVCPEPSVQGVLVTVKVLVGAGGAGAEGLLLLGQPVRKRPRPVIKMPENITNRECFIKPT